MSYPSGISSQIKTGSDDIAEKFLKIDNNHQ